MTPDITALAKALSTAVAEASVSPDPEVRAQWAEAGVRAVLGARSELPPRRDYFAEFELHPNDLGTRIRLALAFVVDHLRLHLERERSGCGFGCDLRNSLLIAEQALRELGGPLEL